MSDPNQPGAGGGGNDIANLLAQQQAASAGGGGEGGAPTMVDGLARLLGFNAHSTGGLDGILNIQSIWSGLSLQGKGLFASMLDGRGGVLATFFANLGFTFGGNIHAGQAAPTDSGVAGMAGSSANGGSGGGGGGDAQFASLQTMPPQAAIAASMAAAPVAAKPMGADYAPPPRGSRKATRSTKGESSGFGASM